MSKAALPYPPHELDRHPDGPRIRATIAEEIAAAVESADGPWDEEDAVALGTAQAAISLTIERLDTIASGLELGCLAPADGVAQLRELIFSLEEDGE